MFNHISSKLKTYTDNVIGIIALIAVLAIGMVGFFLLLAFVITVTLSLVVLVIVNKLFNNDKYHSKDIQL